MRIGIGLGLGPDAHGAAVAAARQAKAAVPRPDLALAFGSVRLDQARLHAGLASEIDPAVLIGGSSYAEITSAGVTQGSVAVLLLSFTDARVRLASSSVGRDPGAAGRRLGASLRGAARSRDRLPLGLLLSAFNTGAEDRLLRALRRRLGRVPVFGGMSVGDYDAGMGRPEFWENYQYCGGRLERKGAGLALLDLPRDRYDAAFGFEHGWDPVAPPVKLTRCLGNEVFEVDGMPVFDYYRQFLGRARSREFFSLMIQRYGFSLELGAGGERRSVFKIPVRCDFKRGSIRFFPAEDLQGKTVRLVQASRRGVLQGTRRAAERCKAALRGAKPSLVLAVTCCTRGKILHSRAGAELEIIRRVLGRDVPVFGYYSGGEFLPYLSRPEEIVDPARELSGSHYHATTIGLLALARRGGAVALAQPSPSSSALKPAEEARRLRAMLEAGERTLDDTEAFLANLSRKSYRDGELISKANEVIRCYTPHDVWSGIGENVARGEYGLRDADFRGAFLFMDVKGFTAFSESRRPAQVVSALNAIFSPATEIVYRHGGEVDKYIGDCIFAVFPRPREAVLAGKDILRLFARVRREGHPFSVRVGVNAGRAVRANVGSAERREYTFIGDAVNLAQRLESNCSPGKLLVEAGLYRRAKVRFAAAAPRRIAVKGRSARVSAVECSVRG